MYTISDVFDMGEAHELILSDIKILACQDDSELMTFLPQEFFDSVD